MTEHRSDDNVINFGKKRNSGNLRIFPISIVLAFFLMTILLSINQRIPLSEISAYIAVRKVSQDASVEWWEYGNLEHSTLFEWTQAGYEDKFYSTAGIIVQVFWQEPPETERESRKLRRQSRTTVAAFDGSIRGQSFSPEDQIPVADYIAMMVGLGRVMGMNRFAE